MKTKRIQKPSPLTPKRKTLLERNKVGGFKDKSKLLKLEKNDKNEETVLSHVKLRSSGRP